MTLDRTKANQGEGTLLDIDDTSLYNYPVGEKGPEIKEINSSLFKYPKTIKTHKGQKTKDITVIHAGGKYPVFIDWISLTFPCTEDGHKGAIDDHLRGMALEAAEFDKHLYKDDYSYLARDYRKNYYYWTPAKNLIEINYDPKNPKLNFLRLRFNPNSLAKANETGYLTGLFLALFSGHEMDWDNVQVSRLDVTLDIPFPRELVHVTAKGYRVSKTYNGGDNMLETEYCGGDKSHAQYVVYDKEAERKKKLGPDYIPTKKKLTRIEVRIRDMSIKEVTEAKPFHKAKIYVLPPHPKMDNFVVAWLLDSIKVRGATAALAMVTDPKQRKEFKAVLDAYRAEFWKPDTIQEQYLGELDTLITMLKNQ